MEDNEESLGVQLAVDVDVCILVAAFYLHRNIKVQKHTGFGHVKSLWPQWHSIVFCKSHVLALNPSNIRGKQPLPITTAIIMAKIYPIKELP